MTKQISLGKHLIEIPDGTEIGKMQLSKSLICRDILIFADIFRFHIFHIFSVHLYGFIHARKPGHRAEQLLYQHITKR